MTLNKWMSFPHFPHWYLNILLWSAPHFGRSNVESHVSCRSNAAWEDSTWMMGYLSGFAVQRYNQHNIYSNDWKKTQPCRWYRCLCKATHTPFCCDNNHVPTDMAQTSSIVTAPFANNVSKSRMSTNQPKGTTLFWRILQITCSLNHCQKIPITSPVSISHRPFLPFQVLRQNMSTIHAHLLVQNPHTCSIGSILSSLPLPPPVAPLLHDDYTPCYWG